MNTNPTVYNKICSGIIIKFNILNITKWYICLTIWTRSRAGLCTACLCIAEMWHFYECKSAKITWKHVKERHQNYLLAFPAPLSHITQYRLFCWGTSTNDDKSVFETSTTPQSMNFDLSWKGLIWPWRYRSRSSIRNRKQKGHKLHILCEFENISSNPSRLIAVTVGKCQNQSRKGLIWPWRNRSTSSIFNRCLDRAK